MADDNRKLLLLLLLLLTVSGRRRNKCFSGEERPTTTKRPKNFTLWLRRQINKPLSAERFCQSMVPPFGVKPRNTESPYTIEYSREQHEIFIRVLGNDTVKWQGFAFQIRHRGLPVGRFYTAIFLRDGKTYRFGCNPREGSRHRGFDTIYRYAPNYLRKVFVTWKPPVDLNRTDRNYNFTLHATMIREFPTFWLQTIPLLRNKGVDNMSMTYDHIQNDALPTRGGAKELSWSEYFKFSLLRLFRKTLITLKLWEPEIVGY